MRVRNKYRKLADIADEQVIRRLSSDISGVDYELFFSIGEEYNVYGIEFRKNSPFCYVCTIADLSYPTPYPIEFLEVIDARLSKYWQLSVRYLTDGKVRSSLVFEEWSTNPMFYERLLDGVEEEKATFLRYKVLMDQEYS